MGGKRGVLPGMTVALPSTKHCIQGERERESGRQRQLRGAENAAKRQRYNPHVSVRELHRNKK